MTSEKLNAQIEKEKANLDKLLKQKEALDAKIKKSQTKLAEYEMLANNQKYGALSSIASKSGLSVDDLLAALQSGDLLALQERMEAAQTASEQSEQLDGEGTDNDYFKSEGGEE